MTSSRWSSTSSCLKACDRRNSSADTWKADSLTCAWLLPMARTSSSTTSGMHAGSDLHVFFSRFSSASFGFGWPDVVRDSISFSRSLRGSVEVDDAIVAVNVSRRGDRMAGPGPLTSTRLWPNP